MKEVIYTFNQIENNRQLINLEICGISYCDGSYEIERRHSKIACIEYIESGEGTVITDERTFYPSAGDSYFLQTGQNQHYFSDGENPWVKYFINVSGRLFESMVDGYGLKFVNRYKNLDIKNELTGIISLAENGGDCTKDVIRLLDAVFYKMYMHTVKGSGGDAEILRNYIDKNITSDIHIGDLCAIISKSEAQTIRIFKNKYNVTPYSYLLNKRTEAAKSMLLNTNMPVNQIAAALKFSDAYWFSNFFKSKTSISPLKFRNQGRK